MKNKLSRPLKCFALGAVLALVGLTLWIALFGPAPGAEPDARTLRLGPLEIARIEYDVSADGSHHWRQRTNPIAIGLVVLVGGLGAVALAPGLGSRAKTLEGAAR